MENVYTEYKKNAKSINDFEFIFYAFSEKQFDAGMKKMGLEKNELKKIIGIGYGAYILKAEKKNFLDLMDAVENDLKNKLKDIDFFECALRYELDNHEVRISGSIADAVGSLGMEIKDITGDTKKNDVLEKILSEIFN